MPGGCTRTATHYDPFPLGIDRGDGCYVYDVDGNEYIDLLNNYTPLVHGHSHPRIVEAITRTATAGLSAALPAPTVLQESSPSDSVPAPPQSSWCASPTPPARRS